MDPIPTTNHSEFNELEKYLLQDDEGKSLLHRINQLKLQNKQYSDLHTIDEHKNYLQYVQLVQEGGGTLGICLVGFCFVMEFLNIRFLKLAGTSAGAINTYLMAALAKNKDHAVTPKLFKLLMNMNMFSFVDGSKSIQWLIKNIISKNKIISGIIKVLLGAIAVIFFFMIIKLVAHSSIAILVGATLLLLCLYFFTNNAFLKIISQILLLISGSALLIQTLNQLLGKTNINGLYYVAMGLIILFIILIVPLFLKFKSMNYGLNPGDEFYDWVSRSSEINSLNEINRYAKFTINKETGQVQENATDTPTLPYKFYLRETPNNIDIINKFNAIYQKQYGLYAEKEKFKNLEADFAFITVDINSERKVEFPTQASLYWEDAGNIDPALFVRASMSIPLFFQPLKVTINAKDENIQNQWKAIFTAVDQIPQHGLFVDGGAISNFPISIFHNDRVIVPRLPVIGIRILDAAPSNTKTIKQTFMNYAGKIINTLRAHNDKDFLTKNNFYERYSIADIKAYETKASWLDFNMKEDKKRALFLKGVSTAVEFFEKFNWDAYKEERARVYYEYNK